MVRRHAAQHLLSLLAILFALLPSAAVSQNFAGNLSYDELRALKVAHNNAMYRWFPSQVTGWSEPIRVTVNKANPVASGTTVFDIRNGRAFNFRMQINGGAWDRFTSVIPHEANHTVFATALGKSLPRWLDEGMASMQEDGQQFQKVTNRLHRPQFPDNRIWSLLDAMEYPRDATANLDLYAEGTALTLYLVQRFGEAKVVELARQPRIEQSWERVFGESTATTRQKLYTWITNQGYMKRASAVLYVWGGPSCTYCRDFWRDYDLSEPLRRKIHSRWRVVYVPFESVPEKVREHKISAMPAFGSPYVGYAEGYTSGELADWYTTVSSLYDRRQSNMPQMACYPIAGQSQSIAPRNRCDDPTCTDCYPQATGRGVIRSREKIRYPIAGIGIPVGPPQIIREPVYQPPTSVPASQPQSAPQVIVAPCQDDIRRMVNEYLQANPPPAGRDGASGTDGRDAQIDEQKIVADVLSKIPRPRDGVNGADGRSVTAQEVAQYLLQNHRQEITGPAGVGTPGPQGERGLVGVPDDQDIRNWLVGATSDPETRQLLMVILGDLAKDLIARLEALEDRVGDQAGTTIDNTQIVDMAAAINGLQNMTDSQIRELSDAIAKLNKRMDNQTIQVVQGQRQPDKTVKQVGPVKTYRLDRPVPIVSETYVIKD